MIDTKKRLAIVFDVVMVLIWPTYGPVGHGVGLLSEDLTWDHAEKSGRYEFWVVHVAEADNDVSRAQYIGSAVRIGMRGQVLKI